MEGFGLLAHKEVSYMFFDSSSKTRPEKICSQPVVHVHQGLNYDTPPRGGCILAMLAQPGILDRREVHPA